MRYFKVDKVETDSKYRIGEVDSDGEYIDENRGVCEFDDGENSTIKYIVTELDEAGFPTRTMDYKGDDALDRIKEDYPADEWQNNNW